MFEINDLIENRDLKGILGIVREFHGHICPYVALGVKASVVTMDELGVKRLSFDESVQERILAIVECNNCFIDGVQVTTGCTLGNNSLIYFDLGKNALTLVKRGTWEGIRIYIDSERLRDKYFPKEALELFEKVVVQRSGTSQEIIMLSKLWEEIGYKMLEFPKEKFKIEHVQVPSIEQAPIFGSTRCSLCGELVMETRIVYIDKKPYCLKCAPEKYHALTGEGIVEKGSNG
jgi:formylmethanofuran dehydrogenase subunit E